MDIFNMQSMAGGLCGHLSSQKAPLTKDENNSCDRLRQHEPDDSLSVGIPS